MRPLVELTTSELRQITSYLRGALVAEFFVADYSHRPPPETPGSAECEAFRVIAGMYRTAAEELVRRTATREKTWTVLDEFGELKAHVIGLRWREELGVCHVLMIDPDGREVEVEGLLEARGGPWDGDDFSLIEPGKRAPLRKWKVFLPLPPTMFSISLAKTKLPNRSRSRLGSMAFRSPTIEAGRMLPTFTPPSSQGGSLLASWVRTPSVTKTRLVPISMPELGRA